MKPLTTRTKLTIFYAAAVGCVLLCFGLLAYEVAGRRLLLRSDETLDQLAAGTRGYISFSDGKPVLDYNVSDREELYFITVSTQYCQIYDLQDGSLLWQSEASRLLRLAIAPEQVRAIEARLKQDTEIDKKPARPSEFDEVEVQEFVRPSMFDEVEGGDAKFRFHSMIVGDRSGHTYLVRQGKSLARHDAALREIRNAFLMLIPVGVLFAAAGGWWMARRALKPVDDLRAAAQSISISRLHYRLPASGAGDELDRLAATFNEVFARLERAVDQMKQFTASIAHELRTPLSALQGEAEFVLLHGKSVEEFQHVLSSQLTEFSRLNSMFNQLLLLARAEAGEVQLALERVDFAGLARSLAEQMQPVAEYGRVALQVEGEDSVAVMGDPAWLKSAVLNLLDNAIKFTSAGGVITVGVCTRNGKAVLEVRDTGIGIPADAIPRLFDRFFRVDSARSNEVPGVGLGLTIVKWAVEAHGGQIQVESTPGQGSRFAVLLPLAPAAAEVGAAVPKLPVSASAKD